jgi:hypothetical protein
VTYTNKQLLVNAIDLLTRYGMYTCDMEDWNRRADTNMTWLHLHRSIQIAYQSHLQKGAPTAAQGGYTNRYAGLFVEDEVSNRDTAETIA